jgi:hypothetical protein
VIHHPWTGEMDCKEGEAYPGRLWKRQQDEAKNLAALTGWGEADIKKKMNLADKPPKGSGKAWYQKLWAE